MRHQHHSIDYVEIYVDDVAAAKRFYGEVFGWRFNDYGDAYAGIQAPDGDGEVGGITTGDNRGASPLVLVITEDLDASLAAVKGAGRGRRGSLRLPGRPPVPLPRPERQHARGLPAF